MTFTLTRPQGTPDIRIIQLPHETDGTATWSMLVARFRDIRLHALKTSPNSFASTYTREADFEPSAWEDRLRNPLAQTFVAVAEDVEQSEKTRRDLSLTDVDDDIVLLLTGRWVGVIVVMGPKEESFVQATKSPWETIASPNVADGATTPRPAALFFHMNSVFTDPGYRGRGIGKALIKEAYSQATVEGLDRGFKSICCTILVDKANVAALSLYETCGFKVNGDEILTIPRKEGVDGAIIPEHETQVLQLARNADF